MNPQKRIIILMSIIVIMALACSLTGQGQPDTGLSAEQIALQETQLALNITQTAMAAPSAEDQQNPTPEQPTAPPPTEPAAQVGVEGALLAYDATLAGQITAQVAEAAVEGPYQAPHPRHAEFSLMGGQGVISMVPVFSYSLVYPDSEQIFAQMQTAINTPQSPGYSNIPEVPVREFFNIASHQEFVASPAKINFIGGSGLRFVTVYGIQDISPVDNDNLRYVFQGLTDDGQCYLSIQFNIAHSNLPQSGTIPDEVYLDTTGDLLGTYFGDLAVALSQDEAGYTPALNTLDAIIGSLEVIQCGVNQ